MAAYFVSPCSEEAAAVLLPLLFSFFLARTLGLVALLACLALVVVPFPFFFPLGLAQLFGSGEGHLGTQGVPIAQGLPLIQGLLALITIGYPFVQGFDLVFQGFARQKREKTSLT